MELFIGKSKRPVLSFVVFAIGIAAVVASVSWYVNGPAGPLATLLAFAVCGGSGLASIISINFLRYVLKKDFACIMMGILFRSGVPMFVLIGIVAFAEKEFGIFLMIHFLVLYLSMLPLEVVLTLPERDAADGESANAD